MAGDANYASVSLLLHCDGSNGSTTFTDSSPTPKVVTAVGNAKISTAQSKFGTASCALDVSGDYLTIPHNAAFSIQGGDFTIEMWVRRAASGVSHYLMSKRSPTLTDGWEWRINATNFMQFFHTGGSSVIGDVSVPSGAWCHIAVCRSGSSLTMWIDGAAAGAGTVSSGTENTDTTIKLGCDNVGSTGFNGYIDDIRITKGIARYTTSFTPAGSEFPDYAGQVSGNVKDSAGANAARTVRAYRRDTGALVGSTTSNGSTGNYTINCATLEEVTVIALDNATSGTYYNDLAARVIPA